MQPWYSFPAIRGVQAGREYYVSMCPLRVIPRLFLFDEEDLVPELRAQRILNKGRVPEIARYLADNPKSYIFSAITASVDADVEFAPVADGAESHRIGVLRIPMEARFVINDGQHRRAAIELALRERPELGDETIAVVLFLDVGLSRCQQMFADLNRYAIRPARSLNVLYDHRDAQAQLAKLVVFRCGAFHGLVEMERSALSERSRKLFTLSAIHTATKALLQGRGDGETLEDRANVATSFWDEVARHFPAWRQVREKQLCAGDLRRDFIHSHAITLQALGRIGNVLLSQKSWKRRLAHLADIDWSRSNAALWEGRALTGGRVSKNGQNVTLMTNAIKHHLGLSLTPDEERVERAYLRGDA
jgi:DNA sulfur modification protein DndB